MKRLRYVLALILLLCIALSLAPVALAQGTAGYVKATSSTQIRESANGESIGTFPKGEIAQALSSSGSWTMINYNGTMGYVLTSKVSVYTGAVSDNVVSSVNVTSSSNKNTAVATATVNIRKGPGTNYSKLGQLKKGDTVSVVGEVSGWTIIDWKDGVAYVSSKYLKSGGTGSASTTVIYVEALQKATIHSGPSSANRVVETMEKNEQAEYISTYGSYYKVSFNGSTGYVNAGNVTIVGGVPEATQGRSCFAIKTARVFNGTGTNAKAYTYMLAGDGAQLVSSNDTWTCVYYKGKTGYVYSDNVVKVTGTGTYSVSDIGKWYYANASKTMAYSIPLESSKYRTGYLDYNEEVWAFSGNSYWTKVYINGKQMFVPTANLSSRPLSGSGISAGKYFAGEVLRIKAWGGASVYTSTLGHLYVPEGENTAYGEILRGTRVTVMRTHGNYIMVCWVEDRDEPANKYRMHVGFILEETVE
ncbi:SH3 domain-containing protein [Eubacteriales bacterium OttesenSCG-928-K08]|nr:SH3 domain-containing protein [Eubacteriales bacterium OttesenSCG-928-K08]